LIKGIREAFKALTLIALERMMPKAG
jgi:hypothetical protein